MSVLNSKPFRIFSIFFLLTLPLNTGLIPQGNAWGKETQPRNAGIYKRNSLDGQIERLELKIQALQSRMEETHETAPNDQGPFSSPSLMARHVNAGQERSKEVKPAKRPISEWVSRDVEYPIDIYDPWEGLNRSLYKFNAKFDRYVFLPVVHGYEYITPDFLQDRVSSVFNNIEDIRNLLNSLLQLKFKRSGETTLRFLINTVYGIGGLWDHATAMGFPEQEEDFGQTLGHYGVGDGPYMVLPIFGPSNLRDTTGLVVDSVARYFYLYQPLDLDENTEWGAVYTLSNAIDTRHKIKFRYYETGSPFEYDLVRYLYAKVRMLEIEK